MNKIFSSFLIVLLFSSALIAQDLTKAEAPKIQKELLFFSNDGCGKCKVTKSYFDKHNMPYQKLPIKENRPLMYEFIHEKTGSRNAGVGYPVLVYGDSIYFSIRNLTETLSEIRKMMEDDGLIDKSKTSHKK